MILLSDGEDNASAASEEQMKQQLESSGNPMVFVLWVPAVNKPGVPRGPDSNDRAALRLTRIGGGLTYFPRNEPDLEAAVDQLADAMKGRYILTYQAQNPAHDGRARRVEVSGDKAHLGKKAVVGAPEAYYPPPLSVGAPEAYYAPSL